MKLITTLLMAIPALLLAQSDPERLTELNRQADQHLASYDLDTVEPLLEQALDIAAKLGPRQEALAHIRLFDLFTSFRRRDGGGWNAIAAPHLFRAWELAPSSTPDLVAKYTQEWMRFVRKDRSPDRAEDLEAQVNGLLSKEPPLGTSTAGLYRALVEFPDGSEAQRQAWKACETLSASPNPSSESAGLLASCADSKRRINEYPAAIRFAQAARRAVSPEDGRRLAYETVLSFVVESEAQTAVGETQSAVAAIDAARDTARTNLHARNDIWERLLTARVAALRPLNDSQPEADLKAWHAEDKVSRASMRVKFPKVVKTVEPKYTKQARAKNIQGTTIASVLVGVDGTGKVVAMTHRLPFGLSEKAEEAIRQWTFRPYTKDGNPVAGMATIEVSFRLK